MPQRQPAAPGTSQAPKPRPRTTPLPRLWKSPFGLLHSIVQSVTATVEKKEQQTAGTAISLSHRSIINSGACSTRALGPWPRLPRGQSPKIPRRGCRGRSTQSPRPPGASTALSALGCHRQSGLLLAPAQSPSLGTALPAPQQPRSATRQGPISPTGSREI